MKRLNVNTYSTTAKHSFADKAAYNTRVKIFKKLLAIIDLEKAESIIDVGVTADKTYMSSNFFENLFLDHKKITAFSDQDASWMENEYKGLTFKQGTVLDMPFENNTFDLVFSSAVIEHVGSIKNQSKFLSECFRISKKYVFLTTPNRHYPIELHTAMPFIHLLPKNIHRKILKFIGKSFFALEENLNLLTKNDLRKLCFENGIPEYKILTVNFLGLPSNLLLILTKN
ncbi:MAG: class I SAM-dependent methyltransferase [Helicobacteraceae bacterium]|jgi:ubiquinone/menaquinone biosynthesis C-methylase UbiE|nr:class I SAM-dependent methyltransferase [Helicobacteraceae bacterium]